MKYLIIGLGIYGSNLALDLAAMGHEVIGADHRQNNIDAVKDYISTVYLIDATEESALNVLPLKNVDLVIVAIGENFGASIKTVALLKKMGVPHIYARAIDKLHEAILEGMCIDRIITPEQRAAMDLTHEMELGAHVDSMKIDEDTYVLKFKTPEIFIGEKYADLSLDDYGLKLIALTRATERVNVLGIRRKQQTSIACDTPDLRAEAGDVMTVVGPIKGVRTLYRKFMH